MGTYLAIMTPEAPYTFSTDQKSKYANAKDGSTGKESYYITSNLFPEQTTLWGMMRLLLLEQAGKVKSDFNYDGDELEKIRNLIGEESFKFESPKEQDFGKLKSISPVFLCETDKNGNIQYIVKNPMCNTSKECFEALAMEKTDVCTDFGTISMPVKFDAKEGAAGGYVNLHANKCYSDDDLFISIVQAGNQKNENGKLKKKDRNDGAFFRRVRYMLKNEGTTVRSFGFFVDVEDDVKLSSDLVTVGAGKNVFSIRFEKKEKGEDLTEQLKEWGKTEKNRWGYALSDIVVRGLPEYTDFAIVSMRTMRNLETKSYREKHSYHERFSRRKDRILLIERGSVFFGDSFKPAEDKNLEKLGYNQIIPIGGEDK